MSETIQFDPALRQLLLEKTGNLAGEFPSEEIGVEEVPVVAKLADPSITVEFLTVVARFGQVVTGRVALNRIVEVRQNPNIVSLKASETHEPDLALSVPEINASPEALREQIGPVGVTGRGVVVGVADWGCDFAHANFRDKQGNTRLLYLWDQRGGLQPESPAPFGYGRELNRDRINLALTQEDPYAALGYDCADADPKGVGSHGTHVMDIAAGNGRAPGASPGVAPGADLIFVHLKGDDTRPGDTLGDSVRLLEAIRYIADRAGNQPVVINMSLGRTKGPHDGSTPLEQGLDALLDEKPGIAICMSTGNYFGADMHSSGQIKAGEYADLRWQVTPRNNEIANMEVWYSGADVFNIEVIDPSGRSLADVALGDNRVIRDGERIIVSIFHREHDPNGDNHCVIFLWADAMLGTWITRLHGETVTNGQYHAWIERDDPAFQSRFTPECAVQTSTTNTICNGFKTIAVGAYDAREATHPLVPVSSEGPTRDNRIIPNISAPGAGIRAARSSYPRNGYREMNGLTTKSGSSMAAPHVTGTVALMFETAGEYRLSIEETRDILLRTARSSPPYNEFEHLRYGAGRVDAAAAVKEVRAMREAKADPNALFSTKGAPVAALTSSEIEESYGKDYVVVSDKEDSDDDLRLHDFDWADWDDQTLRKRLAVILPSLLEQYAGQVVTGYAPTGSVANFLESDQAPRLLDCKTTPPSQTLYVEIDLGIGIVKLCKKYEKIDENKKKCIAYYKPVKVQPKTGIFIPENYSLQTAVDLILYLHGHTSYYPGLDASIDGYWGNPKFPFFALREEINASKKNVILIAPTLGPGSEPGTWITQEYGLDRYLDQVLEALKAYGPYQGKSPTIGNIILACHSGGGSPMQKLALATNRCAANIKECWGFDSLYGGVVEGKNWRSWAHLNQKTGKKLFIYYYNTKKNSEELKKDALDEHLLNVSVKEFVSKSSFKDRYKVDNLGDLDDHFKVPITYFRERLQDTSFLNQITSSEQETLTELEFNRFDNYLDEAFDQEFSDETNEVEFDEETDVASLDWSLANNDEERDTEEPKELLDELDQGEDSDDDVESHAFDWSDWDDSSFRKRLAVILPRLLVTFGDAELRRTDKYEVCVYDKHWPLVFSPTDRHYSLTAGRFNYHAANFVYNTAYQLGYDVPVYPLGSDSPSKGKSYHNTAATFATLAGRSRSEDKEYFSRFFEVVVWPSQDCPLAIREGDILLRGPEPGFAFGHMAIIVDPTLYNMEDPKFSGRDAWQGKGVQSIDAGGAIRTLDDCFGRVLTDTRGRVLANRMVLRLKESVIDLPRISERIDHDADYRHLLEQAFRSVDGAVLMESGEGSADSSDLTVAVPGFTPAKRTIISPVLNSRKNAEALQWNQGRHPAVSGVDPKAIRAVLTRYVNFDAVNVAITNYNVAHPKAPIVFGMPPIDAVFVEAVHQFQAKCFVEAKQQDGMVGGSILDSLGLVTRTGLNTVDQRIAGLIGTDSKARRRLNEVAGNLGGSTTKDWYQNMVTPTFLGQTFKNGIHIILARKLRIAESYLLSLPAYSGMTPVELGDALGINEDHKGGRPNPNSASMHTFGLAVDIKYEANPWVGGQHNSQTGNQQFSEAIKHAALLISATRISFPFMSEYFHSLGTNPRMSTADIYDTLYQRNLEFRAYLQLVTNIESIKQKLRERRDGRTPEVFESESETIEAAAERWQKKIQADLSNMCASDSNFGSSRDPLKGFLNLSRDLVIALRDHACLAWGAVDIGPKESGDMMHFDCRVDDVGKILNQGYSPTRGHPCLSSSLSHRPAESLASSLLAEETPKKQEVPTRCEIVIQTQDTGATQALPLREAWVYWREGQNLTLLRTDGAGHLLTADTGAARTHSWEYTSRFFTNTGTQVNLYFSYGSLPIPDALLNSHPGIFLQRTVALPSSQSAQTTASITLPNILIQLTRPAELSLWPLLWELPTDVYHTDGLNQDATLWHGSNLTVVENGPALQPSLAVRPKERGLAVEGAIDARATGVKIQILDAKGNTIQLRQHRTATANITEFTGDLGAASGNIKPFKATIYFADAAAAFGLVQVLVLSDGITPPIMGTFTCHLAGLQIALVNDYVTNVNGQNRGPISTETDEKIIVDFLDSPQSTLADITNQTRARRMVTYQMANRDRPLSGTNPTMVLKPEMPLWMAEFQIVGMNKAQLDDFMVRRKHFLPTNPTNLQIELHWRMTLSWDGPDSHTTSPRRYQYSQDFRAIQTANIRLNSKNQIDGINNVGEVVNGFTPAPTSLTFPIAGRRLPHVIVSGQSRRWGRQITTPAMDTILIEWQPRIVDATRGNEILRGGDGILQLESVTINGMRIDGGLIPSNSGPIPALRSLPDIQSPRFRVRGFNPPSPANMVIDALVADYFNAHHTLPRTALLSLVCWQETIRRILAHEAGHQFEYRGVARRKYAGVYYGHEQDMPLFGPPHGYGYGQHDNPPVTDNGAWSFFENIRESVRRVMEDKASLAYNHISTHIPAPVDQRTRAVYQREIVRRYNGGSEFQWDNTAADWKISPTIAQWANPKDHTQGANPLLSYPNHVLGTNVIYSTGAHAATVFPWPINFTTADYGPET